MTTYESLDEQQCYDLLRTQEVGRFAVIEKGYPLVFPVNYVIDKGDVITFRTARGTKLRASQHTNICFEADYFSTDRRQAWSVIVLGAVDHRGATFEEREHIEQLDVQPLASGDRPAWVRLIVHRITGRRFLNEGDQPFAFDSHAYL